MSSYRRFLPPPIPAKVTGQPMMTDETAQIEVVQTHTAEGTRYQARHLRTWAPIGEPQAAATTAYVKALENIRRAASLAKFRAASAAAAADRAEAQRRLADRLAAHAQSLATYQS